MLRQNIEMINETLNKHALFCLDNLCFLVFVEGVD